MRGWKIAGGTLAAFGLIVAGFLAFLHLAPEAAERAVLAGERAAAGFAERSVLVDGARIRYLDTGGPGEAVVLVHGIYAEKDHWDRMAARMAPGYRLLAIDVPGFGESAMPEGGHYSYAEQVPRLRRVLKTIGLERYHLAGNSMGGAIVAQMAAAWPEETLSVAYLGGVPHLPGVPPGVLDKAHAAGERSPMIVTHPDDYRARLDILFVTRPFLPGPILRVWAEREAARGALNQRIWEEVAAFRPETLAQSLGRITAPAFVFWGEGDALFHVAGATRIAALMSATDADVQVLEACGHLPMMERPADTAQAYSAFLAGLE